MNIPDFLRGITTNPALVGFARGVAEAVVFVVVWSVADFVAANGLPDPVAQYGPVLLLLLRTLEGAIDNIDPAKQRAGGDAGHPFD